jgi:hypothetical protein
MISQGDASCVAAALDKLERAVAQQRPDILPWFQRMKSARVGGLATSADYVVVLDDLVRGLQKSGAGGVVKDTLTMAECPTAYMIAVRLGTIAPS